MEFGDEELVKLSVLDYTVIDEGKDAESALQDSLNVARLADKLGYSRIWFTEHHNVPAFACGSPELMMMQTLSQTTHIRVGSGGVMLPHYRPYKVAEQFRMLEALHPNRVDLGIGNNPGTAVVRRALDGEHPQYADYHQSIEQLRQYLTASGPATTNTAIAQPEIKHTPEMWLLSGSTTSATFAATQGMGLAVATFLLPDEDKIMAAQQNVALYRQQFQKTALNMQPSVAITAFVVVADSDEEVAQLQHALDVWLLGKDNFAEFKRFPSFDTAQHYQLTARDKEMIANSRARIIAGTKDEVATKLDQFVAHFDADEVIVAPLIPGVKARMRTLELLADIYL